MEEKNPSYTSVMRARIFATDKLLERAFNADMIKSKNILRLNRVTWRLNAMPHQM